MSYFYEVVIELADGPDDVTTEVREFEKMREAVSFAKRNEGCKLFLVFKDTSFGQVEDRAELPLKMA